MTQSENTIELKCLKCGSLNLTKDDQDLVTCINCKEQIRFDDLVQQTGDKILQQLKPKGPNWK